MVGHQKAYAHIPFPSARISTRPFRKASGVNIAGFFRHEQKGRNMASFHYRINSGKKGTAFHHAVYICRLWGRIKRGDLIETGHGNMPSFAAGQPLQFWKMADKHERANGAAYREHVVALPRELGPPQQQRLVRAIVDELTESKPYHFAVHSPRAALGNDANPHLHLMYSDRLDDGIDRPPEQMFARYNAKEPEKGGRRKASGGKARWQVRDQVIATRKLCADLQNKAFAEAGIDARVDHRSLREQGKQKKPEKHLGAARIRRMSVHEKTKHVSARKREIVPPANRETESDTSSCD